MRYHCLAAMTLLLAGAGCYCAPDGTGTPTANGGHRGRRNPPPTERVLYDNAVPGAPVYEPVPVASGQEAPFNPQEARGTAVIRRDQQFEDIPVPPDFRLDRSKMFSFQGSAFRYGKFPYEGQWSYNRTRQFYLEQMPLHEWQMVRVNDQFPPNGEIQRYQRGHEFAEVTLRRGSDVGRILVEVVVRDSRRPDPMLLADARMNVAPVTPGSTPVTTTVVSGRPYRAPLYTGESVPGAVALDTSGPLPASAVAPVVPAYATPVYGGTAYAGSTYQATYGQPLPATSQTMASAPAGTLMTNNAYAEARPLSQATPAWSSASASTVRNGYASGQTVYRSATVTRSAGTYMPFDTVNGKKVDPRTFALDEPAGVGIEIR